MAEFSPYVCMQTNSRCYKRTTEAVPVGILWHSTGANNPYLKRYVQPTEGSKNEAADLAKLGKNTSKNDWNHLQISSGLNAWIGKFADDTVGTVQTMPWNYAPWGCGSGKNGSCNKTKLQDGRMGIWIQFEICEDGLNDKTYAEQVYKEAVALTAYLCKIYKIKPDDYVTTSKGIKVPTITCHNDASKIGMATGHSDINHWFPRLLNKDMEAVRRDVGAAMGDQESSAPVQETTSTPAETTAPANTDISYKVKVTAGALNVRKGAGTNYGISTVIKKGEIYTIVEEKSGWGKLKSGVGWIMLKYTSKV